jgi:hypothetical protein
MPEESATLLAVAARVGVAPEDRGRRLQRRAIVVIAQAAQIFANLAERAPNKKVGGNVIDRVASVASVGR